MNEPEDSNADLGNDNGSGESDSAGSGGGEGPSKPPATLSSTPTTSTSMAPVAETSPDYEESVDQAARSECQFFWPNDRSRTLQECADICGDEIARDIAAGNYTGSSVVCSAQGTPVWGPQDGTYISYICPIALHIVTLKRMVLVSSYDCRKDSTLIYECRGFGAYRHRSQPFCNRSSYDEPGSLFVR